MVLIYTLSYHQDVVKKDIPRLDKEVRQLIKRAIEERLTTDPIGFGKPLRYSLKGHRRLRVGNYRVVYKINYDSLDVTIIAIKHRKDIYQKT